MGDIALKVEDLTKEYTLGTIGHGTLYRDMQSAWARLRGKDDPNSLVTNIHNDNSDKTHFLALDDLNFEIKKGDRVGIIGKNGAGKSTLLKVLSRITAPTKGNIYIDGRIGSLLEVGTGFHPELTGRENIFLNGAIMGMRKREIASKFDEIVDFAGVEKFIDTPIKRYSSGMFVRLGFAVAAHLEPEILIVDEVLAVGDAEFQNKAIGKMEDVSNNEGRTILFVSHNMASVRKLCTSGIVLSNGQMHMSGTIDESINSYTGLLKTQKIEGNRTGKYSDDRRGSGTLTLTDVKICDRSGREKNVFETGTKAYFRISYETFAEMEDLYISIVLYMEPGSEQFLTESRSKVETGKIFSRTKGSALIEVDLSFIREGEYPLYFWLGDKKALTEGIPTNYDLIDRGTLPLLVRNKISSESLVGVMNVSSKILEKK